MDTNESTLKTIAKICLAAIGVLFIGGMVFYKERVLFSDAAFVIFSIINDNNFAIQGGRYGSFILQVLPYIGVKMHLSVSTIMLLYGMSFNLFYLSAASIMVFWLKQYRLTILMTLFYFLFVSQSYFWISEIPQGVTWMFLCFSVTIYLGNRKTNIFLLIIPFLTFAFLAIFSHFIIIVPAVFLWVYLIIEKKNWPFSGRQTILLSTLLAATFAAKYVITILVSRSSYDANNLQGVTHVSLNDVINSFNTPVIKMFLYRCIVNYWAGAIIFIAGIINLIRNNQKMLLGWTLLSGIGYFVLMGLTFGRFDKGFLLFHAESEWVSFSIIALTPWVFSFMPNRRPLISCLFTAIFISRLVYIGLALPLFNNRNVMQEQILAQMKKKGITKLALINDVPLMKISMLDWGLPFESILMSKTQGENPQRVFLFTNPDNKEYLQQLTDAKGIMISFGSIQPEFIDKKYFVIDTTHGYQILTYEDFMK